jgi:hypothetical protein
MVFGRRYGQMLLALSLVLGAAAAVAVDPTPSHAATECRTYDLDKTDRLKFNELDDASGMIASRVNEGVFWVVNDKAGSTPNILFAIDAEGNRLATLTFNLSGGDDTVPGNFVDFEDIAIGPGPVINADYLYIADTGDNERNRPESAVYRFREPSLPNPSPSNPKSISVSESDIEAQRFTYERFSDPTKTEARDAEAIFIDPEMGDLYIFEKGSHTLFQLTGVDDGKGLIYSNVYRIERSKLFKGTTRRTAPIVSYIQHRYDGQTATGSMITAADISHDGHVIVLRNDRKSFYWTRGRGKTVPSVFNKEPVAPCLGPDGSRGESIAILPDGSAFYGLREGVDPLLSPIFKAEISGFGRIECNGLEATSNAHVGTNGDDVINGTDGNDVIVALGGNDTINAGKGKDVICAGSGNDVVTGGAGSDIIFGRSGNDVLKGSGGKDKLYGGLDADILKAGSGNDIAVGGEHADTLLGQSGADTMRGDNGSDIVNGGDGDDNLSGNAGKDSLDGGAGSDVCNGGGGTDEAAGCESQKQVP